MLTGLVTGILLNSKTKSVQPKMDKFERIGMALFPIALILFWPLLSLFPKRFLVSYLNIFRRFRRWFRCKKRSKIVLAAK